MGKSARNKKRAPEAAQAARSKAKGGAILTKGQWILLRMIIIAAAGLWVFSPVMHGDWLWDDDWLVAKNSLIHDPNGFWKIWLDPVNYLIDYFPLTSSAEWLEWQWWQNDTFNYHLTCILLHISSAWLIWQLLSKFGLRLAWIGGLLFAIHPITVESVAWISELKNTLSLPLFLGAMCALIDYDEQGNLRDYFLALVLFLLAMLSKTSMVMFPFVILLFVWWKRGQVNLKDLKMSLPFFVVSLGLGLATIWFLHHHAINQQGIPMGGIFSHLALGGTSLAFYFFNCIWPVGLLPIYPKWVIDPPSLIQFLPWVIVAAVLWWFWTKRESWGRHALLGLGFFLITIIPFIGFTPGSYMDFTWVMDHFLYIPLIGLIGLAVAGMELVSGRLPVAIRRCGIAMMGAVMVLLAWGSHAYAGMFVGEETFWTYTIQRNPGSWMAQNNLGFALFQSGRISEATEHYKETVRLNPRFAEGHYNFGNGLRETNHIPEAIEQYEEALKIDPNYADARSNLGNMFGEQGRSAEAIEQYQQALKIKPDNADVRSNLGNVLAQSGRISEAIEQYQQALKSNPDNAMARNNLANALASQGRTSEAIEQYEAALKINPDYAQGHNNLGNILAQVGRTSEAIEQYKLSLKINPGDSNVQNQLARLQGIPPPVAPQKGLLGK